MYNEIKYNIDEFKKEYDHYYVSYVKDSKVPIDVKTLVELVCKVHEWSFTKLENADEIIEYVTDYQDLEDEIDYTKLNYRIEFENFAFNLFINENYEINIEESIIEWFGCMSMEDMAFSYEVLQHWKSVFRYCLHYNKACFSQAAYDFLKNSNYIYAYNIEETEYEYFKKECPKELLKEIRCVLASFNCFFANDDMDDIEDVDIKINSWYVE